MKVRAASVGSCVKGGKHEQADDHGRCGARWPDQGRCQQGSGSAYRYDHRHDQAGRRVRIAGFGTFGISERGEGQGRNPQMGEAIDDRGVLGRPSSPPARPSRMPSTALEPAGTASAGMPCPQGDACDLDCRDLRAVVLRFSVERLGFSLRYTRKKPADRSGQAMIPSRSPY